jgi:squalene synthase HpnC
VRYYAVRADLIFPRPFSILNGQEYNAVASRGTSTMRDSKLHTEGKFWSAEESFRYCEHIARSHYENFPVASLFVPRHMRKYVWAIYAFARTADDFADEPGFTVAERLDNLNQWDQHLEDCYAGTPAHRIFVALAETIERFDIPMELFENLLAAFRSDVTVNRYETYDDVLAYCANSANPIGRLLLILFNYRSEATMQLSDAICTGLQLTNFWQDVSVDAKKDRIYLPEEDLNEYAFSERDVLNGVYDERFKQLMEFQVHRTAELFMEGKPLLTCVGKDLRRELDLTWNGGMRILQKIQANKYDVQSKRPALSIADKMSLLFHSFLS